MKRLNEASFWIMVIILYLLTHVVSSCVTPHEQAMREYKAKLILGAGYPYLKDYYFKHNK